MAETTIDARVTMYGFPDNDPPFSANIAHPVLHQQASGIGTFDDPITFAGDPGDIPFGTKIYVPHVQKYFIMEDTCADAMASPNDRLQVDLWAGGSANTDVQQILSVENANTRSSAQVILNAEPGHPVNLTPFDGSPTPSAGAQTPASATSTVSGARIALTFDDGPDPTWTPQVLKVLQDYGVKATFFELGENIEANPNLAKAVVAAGHLVENHTFDHPHLPTLTAAQITTEIQRTSDDIFKFTGTKPEYVRPPYGEVNQKVENSIESMHLKTALWTVDTNDWQVDDGVNVTEQ